MKDRKIREFETVLEGIKVPANMGIEQQAQLMKPISTIVEDMLPSRLYRFRQCSERNFDALYKDQVWASRGCDVNDDYDTCLYYDNKKIKEWLQPLSDEQFELRILNYLKGTEKAPEVVKNLFPVSEEEIEKRFKIIQQLPYEDIKVFATDFKKYIQDNLLERLEKVTLLIQQGVKFACFSENINSAMMWGHYAESGTGFAVGYDFKDGKLNNCPDCHQLGKECFYPMQCHIYPIIYKDKRYDATEYAIYTFRYWLLSDMLCKWGFTDNSQWLNAVMPCPDNSMLSKIAIHKSSEWKSEKEWRLFCTSSRPNFFLEAHSCVRKNAATVYLGRKISSINEKILRDIAREKGIECYKMELNKSQVYKLKPIK